MSIRHVVKTVAASSAATLCGAALMLGLGAGPAGASSLTSSDGNTTLSTIGTVKAGSPYTSGQGITVSVVANSVLSNANLAAAKVPGQYTLDGMGNPVPSGASGVFYIEECTDPGGLVGNLPTSPSACEKATQDFSVLKTNDGSLTDTGYQVYDLPDPNFGATTFTGKCDVAPNQCVIGIFATDPHTGNGFTYPHLFSAPFQVTVGDGQDAGDNPGDGTPEVPLAIGLPLAALAVFGGWTIRNRRRRRQPVA